MARVEESSIYLLGIAVVASLPFLLRPLGLRYHFDSSFEARLLGFTRLATIPFHKASWEGLGIPRMILPELRQRFPGHKVIDLTRNPFSRWRSCAFVNTSDAIFILPEPVARILVSKKPCALWRSYQGHSARAAVKSVEKIARAWPKRLLIGRSLTACLLLGIAGIQIVYSTLAIFMFSEEIQRFLSPAVLRKEMAKLLLQHLASPFFVILCASWSLAETCFNKRPSRLVAAFALMAALSAPNLTGPMAHDLSHASGDSCSSYDDGIWYFVILSIGCIVVMLVRAFAYPSPKETLPGPPSDAGQDAVAK